MEVDSKPRRGWQEIMKKKTLLGILILSLVLLPGVIGFFYAKADAATATKLTVSVKHPKLDTIKLKWNAVASAEGYNVYISLDNGKKYQLATTVDNTSMVFDNLTRDKIYRFKVNAYKTTGGVRTEFLSSKEVISNSNRIGIDVSHHQDSIDWAKVKDSGIEFAMIRVAGTYQGTTTLYKDDYYKENLEGAIANKIPVGVYYFSRATSESLAKRDANYVLNLVKGYKLTYPIVIDMEGDEQDALSKSKNTKIANAFCQVIKDAGYTPMIYSGCYWSLNNFNFEDIPYDFWIAHYGDGTVVNPYYHFHKETDHYPYTRMWQYSSSKIPVGGIKGNVDHNYEFDLKESVLGNTHLNMKTGEITYQVNASDTIQSIAKKNVIAEKTILSMNPNITATTKLSGKTIKIGKVLLGKPVLKITTYQCKTAKLAWNAVLGAYQYTIQRSTSKDGTYTTLAIVDSMKKVYEDTSVMHGKTYYYRVIATGQEGTTIKTASSDKMAFKLVIPTVTNLKATSQNYNTVKLSWNKVTGATGYMIKYATSKDGTYRTLATVTTNSYIKSGLAVGKTYYFKVYTMYNDATGKYYSSHTLTSGKSVVNKVTSLKVSASTYNSVSLTWGKTSDATAYYVYRSVKSGSGYVKIGSTTGTTYKNSSLKTGTTYYYKVVAVRKVSGKYYQSVMSSYVKNKPSLKKAVVTKVTAGTGKITLTYNKVSGASGYQIYRSTSKSGTYKKVTTTKYATYTNKSLSRNKTYYYKVRAYRVVAGKEVYGSFSSIVYKKTK